MIGILETGIETNTNTRKTKSEVVDWWINWETGHETNAKTKQSGWWWIV